MDRQRVKTTLEVTTNIAVLLVAVSILCLLAIYVFVKPRTPTMSNGLQKGQAFGQIANVDYSRSDGTLLIALSTNCSYCQESLPLYRKVANSQAMAEKNLRLVALFPNKAEEVAKYVKDNQLPIDTVADVDLNSLKISGTPTVILVDNKGLVRDFWNGKLSDGEADEFLRAVTPTKEN